MGPAAATQGEGEPPIPTLYLQQERGHASGASGESRTPVANRFTVRDRAGATVGGAFESCAKEVVGARELTAYCSGIIEISGKGKIAFQASRAVASRPDRPDRPDGRKPSVTGVVTGGTGLYDGAGGEMELTPPASDKKPWVAKFR
ncbi:hypothetical protein ACFVYR_13305 [Streptomyces sp. NPDC058284]|uniref:hypothetical protein n=1 Tax=unclassified Streptomyces TaxID=2593676 RepID=UPI0036509B41